MLFLRSQDITEIYVLVDDLVPKQTKNLKGGRPPILKSSEIVTILIWNVLTVQQKTLKSLYRWIHCYHATDFSNLPTYNGFLAEVHRSFSLCLEVLSHFMKMQTPIRFMDSTMLPVCSLRRAKKHRVSKGIATFGKNWQGWHFGFKLHASIDPHGHLTGIFFSNASTHEHLGIPFLVGRNPCIAVGDTSYSSKRFREILWKYRILILAPPNPRSGPKHPMTKWQQTLLRSRTKIEAVFDYLKEHLHLVSSFPRSVKGYLVHYVRILLGYQILSFISED
jgi:hypothetical protein